MGDCQSDTSSSSDADEILPPDTCRCCRRSKSQGTFFQLCASTYHSAGWEWGPWKGSFRDFGDAARQGCRRCNIVFQAGLAYRDESARIADNVVIAVRSLEEFGSGSMLPRIRLRFRDEHGSHLKDLTLVHKPGLADHPYSRVSSAVGSWNLCLEAPDVKDPTSDDALFNCRKWLSDCVNDHKLCALSEITVLPNRILELGEDKVTLKENPNGGLRARYVCLSHCWGPEGPSLRLTQTTTRVLQAGVSIEDLPKTFAETVCVCLKLGVKYLWIDALCIYQDSNEDWEEAASTMGSIYEDAYFTVGAACGLNSTAGLRPACRLIATSNPEVLLQECEGKDLLQILEYHYREWPLMRRGWVFQERLLSPRILFFSKSQIVWHCRSIRCDEKTGLLWDTHEQPRMNEPIVLVQNSSFEGTADNEDLVRKWHRLVLQYSGLELTYDRDRLPAIAALVEHMSRLRINDVYIAGLWKNSLLRDLQWLLFSPAKQKLEIPVPTWSWASVSGTVTFWSFIELLPCVALLDLVFTRVGPAHIGYVTDASVLLEGPITRASRDPLESQPYQVYDVPDLDSHENYRTLSFSDVESAENACEPGSVPLTVIFLSGNKEGDRPRMVGLVLLEVSPGVYRRDGLLQVNKDGSEKHNNDSIPTLQQFVASLPISRVKII